VTLNAGRHGGDRRTVSDEQLRDVCDWLNSRSPVPPRRSHASAYHRNERGQAREFVAGGSIRPAIRLSLKTARLGRLYVEIATHAIEQRRLFCVLANVDDAPEEDAVGSLASVARTTCLRPASAEEVENAMLSAGPLIHLCPLSGIRQKQSSNGLLSPSISYFRRSKKGGRLCAPKNCPQFVTCRVPL
jgi:hypothetical protein